MKKMAFELIKKIHKGKSTNPNGIWISKKSIIFGKNVLEFLKFPKYMEIYVDYENQRLGFKATQDYLRGYTLTENKNKIRNRIQKCSFISKFQQGDYNVEYDFVNQMVILNEIKLFNHENGI